MRTHAQPAQQSSQLHTHTALTNTKTRQNFSKEKKIKKIENHARARRASATSPLRTGVDNVN